MTTLRDQNRTRLRLPATLIALIMATSGCVTSPESHSTHEDSLSNAVIERDALDRLDDMGVQGVSIRNNANQRAAFIEDMRRTRALAAQAVDMGLDTSPLFKQRLAAQRENILAGLYLENQFTVLANEASQRAFFERNKERFSKPQRSAFHIVTRTEVAAKAAISALQEPGSNKEVLLKEFAPSSPEGVTSGSLGTFTRGQMLKPIEDAVFSTAVGKVHPYPVQTAHGWHAILVTAEIPGKPVKFEDVRAEVESVLKSELHHKMVSDALSREKPEEAAR